MNNNRLHGIDLLRGAAVVLMVFYHILFDLSYFFEKPIPYASSIFLIGPEIIGGLFLLTSGLSHSLSFYSHSRKKILRAFFILGIALLITLGTLLFFPDQLILFGILHCIALSTLLSLLLKKLPKLGILLLSLSIIFFGFFWFNSTPLSSPLWIPFGGIYSAQNFVMLDYFPLVPHFGQYLLGLWLGLIFLKPKKIHSPKTPEADRKNVLFQWVIFLGQYSLPIYLIHQPLLLAGLYLVLKII